MPPEKPIRSISGWSGAHLPGPARTPAAEADTDLQSAFQGGKTAEFGGSVGQAVRPEYEAGLRARGDLEIWFDEDAITAWEPAPTGKRGAQRRYSDTAIVTVLTLRQVFHLALRQAEGFVGSLLRLMDLDLEASDHSTLSRRDQEVEVPSLVSRSNGPIHLIVDSTGLKIFGAGEWSSRKKGKKRRSWRKLHLGVDERPNRGDGLE